MLNEILSFCKCEGSSIAGDCVGDIDSGPATEFASDSELSVHCQKQGSFLKS